MRSYEEGSKVVSTFLDSKGELEGPIGLVADREGNILELPLRVRDLGHHITLACLRTHGTTCKAIKRGLYGGGGLTCSPVSLLAQK